MNSATLLYSPGWRARALSYFIIGLLIGGITTGFAASIVGGLISIEGFPVMAAAVGVAGLGLARDFGVLSLRLPQNARLVPEHVTRWGPVLGPLQFGFEMGTGVRTHITATAPYIVVGAVILIGTLAGGVLAGTGFAAGRAAMTMARYTSRKPAEWDHALHVYLTRVVRTCGLIAAGAIWALALWQ